MADENENETTNTHAGTDNEDAIEMNFDEEYNMGNNDQLTKELNINLGSTDIPRYQCANHKLEIVVRKNVGSA